MSEGRPQPRWLLLTVTAAAMTAGGLGGAGLAGWHLGSSLWVQPHPQFSPFWYSAALALTLLGGALALTALGWRRPALALSVLVANLGLVLLGQSLVGLNVGLDGAFFRPGTTLSASQPGHPTLSTALACFLIGGALVGLAVPHLATRHGWNVILASASVMVLSLVGLARYVFDLTVTGLRADMAVQECLGLLAGGLAVACLAARHCPEAVVMRRWAPFAAGASSLTVTLVLWQALTTQEHRRIHRMVQFDAATIQRELLDNTGGRLQALVDVSRRFTAKQRPTEATLDRWTADYLGQHPGCLAVGWDDPGTRVYWANDREAVGTALFESAEELRGLLARLRQSPGTALARAPSGWSSNNRCVLFYIPFAGGELSGGLVAVFRVQAFLDTVLTPNVAPGYAVAILDGEQQVFTRLAAERDFQADWQQVTRVNYYGLDWQVQVWPTSYVMAREPVSLARVALAVGAVMVGLLMLAIYLAQTARQRTRELEIEVHERHQVEKALRENEAKYRSLTENLDHSVFLKDREGRYVACNLHFCQSLGREEPDIRGRTDFELFPIDVAEKAQLDDQQVFAEGTQLEKEEAIVADGKARRLRIIRSPVKDDLGQIVGILGIIWDVTQHRALEDHVRQAQKMEAVGQLAGGIAHDFNNLLTAILGNLSLILESLPPGDPNRPLAESAEKAGARAASLTAQLLGFARKANLRPQPLSLNGVIDEVTAILARTIDPRIRLEAKKSPDLWRIEADQGQMIQVLMNLCINARDSMGDQGRLILETANVEIDEEFTRHHLDARPGYFVRLRVSDTGQGMTSAVLRRIFEPFFTTKGPGKGTGLGLAMVFGIVKSHHGWIDVYSEVGRGTRFDIYLPRLQGEAPHEAAAPRPMGNQGGQETILLADDEPMIRNLGRAILEQYGYRLLLAEDGLQAVELFRQHRDEIDLVILDLTMPNLSGQDAFRQICELHPQVRAMFASGYSADHISAGEQKSILGFVNKPYRPADLVRAVREALDVPCARVAVTGAPCGVGAE